MTDEMLVRKLMISQGSNADQRISAPSKQQTPSQINNINARQQDIHIHLNYNGGDASRNLVVDASLL